MGLNSSAEAPDRVDERRRAVALARHYRAVEHLSIAQIAERLGRSPAP
jgi:DNA-binding MurR/RpiR family transcriptional regulator